MTDLEFAGAWVELGGRPLLRAIDLRLERGQLIALVGPNGSGKTTLLRAALGLVPTTRGKVRLDGDDTRALTPRARAARVAWLPQLVQGSEPLAVHEVVGTGRYRFGERPRQVKSAALAALSRVEALHLAERNVLELSGGERQRVALATALAQESPLLLLDEPANHLDPARQSETYRLVGRLWQGGLGVLLVTHDVNLLGCLPDAASVRVVGLADGAVALDLALCDPMLPAGLTSLFGTPMKAITWEGRRLILPWPAAEGEP